ncbi:MAG TPA: tripartite tricarboxylate transporter substrate-binding protein [Hyphomicrobiales bacterium]|nr:tripartite tricarboxylate transporter substrate-binding protein [Hyphomicrobiales bacterium]
MGLSRRELLLAAAAAPLAGSALAGPAFAADYPARPITTVCPFEAGTGADIWVRYFADELSKLCGKPVITDNKPGAQGTIATTEVAHARPDGYTISITPASSTLATAAHLFKRLPFDPMKDFDEITTIASLSFVFAVDPSSPAKTPAELTEVLKKKGDKARFGESANTGLVAAELYKQRANLPGLQRVQYKAVSDMARDLASGQLDFISIDATWLIGQVRANRMRAVALTSKYGSSSFPGVPTLDKAGFPGFDITPWWGVIVPHGVPAPIQKKLVDWFNEIVASKKTKDFLNRVAADPLPGDPQSFRKLLVSETEAWGKYVKLANIPTL